MALNNMLKKNRIKRNIVEERKIYLQGKLVIRIIYIYIYHFIYIYIYM
jgi:hypothetical protein